MPARMNCDHENFMQGDLPDELWAIFCNHWERFMASVDENLAQRVRYCSELPKVWCASDFVASWCIQRPLDCVELVSSGDLMREYQDQEMCRRVRDALAEIDSEAAMDVALRRLRQREMVRIAWRDLSGLGSLEHTMQDVSDLADACIDAAVAWHHAGLERRFGSPRGEDDKALQLVVLGLGKLGGHELNFSSDIDLIYAFESNGNTDGRRQIDNQEFFIRLGRKVMGSLGRVDADGFVFRTDLRLRPNGDSGPLVLSFPAMEHYYQTHGRDWERYALIKARVVGGDREKGQELLDMLRPFVYRKYLDFSAFDAIREMRVLIDRQLLSDGTTQNIKLGRGGIREIEFLIQKFQLIRGGRDPELQTQSLYRAIEVLVELGVIGSAARDGLMQSYRFLRNLEHRLQMVADRQTQKLPNQPLEQLRIAYAMGCTGWPELLQELEGKRSIVQEYFGEALELPEDAQQDPFRSQMEALWQGQFDLDAARHVLEQSGFINCAEVPDLLERFRAGGLCRAFSNVDRTRLDRLMPLALSEAGCYPYPARAIDGFLKIIGTIGRRSVYLSLLIENPLALQQLMHLCAVSGWIARHIGQYPVVLDELLQPLEKTVDFDRTHMQAELDQRMRLVEPGDQETRMNAMREFHHCQMLRVAAADVSGELDEVDVGHALTLLAEMLLEQVLSEAITQVEEKLGSAPGKVAIIAYGKFAAGEMGYHSDLDIVVFYDPVDEESRPRAEHFFSRVGRRLIHLLSTRTYAGFLYKLDMRLRPSGRSGPLVTSLKAFRDYQRDDAWTWEHQALVRTRVVAGDQSLVEDFESVRRDTLGRMRDEAALKADIVDMRKRMVKDNCRSDENHYDLKLDYGGIVDIEFLLQYLVLQYGAKHPSLLGPRNTLTLVWAIQEVGLLDAEAADRLGKTYWHYLRRYRDLKLVDLDLADQPALIPHSEFESERAFVLALWAAVIGT